MRKIPTLFKRDPEDRKHVLPEVTPGCEWVLAGEGIATRKYDGTCVRIDSDRIWTRREVKPGKAVPPEFVEIETDPNTGKTVGWEPAEQSGFIAMINEALTAQAADHSYRLPQGTYELCGPKINRNPEGFERHTLIRHGTDRLEDVLLPPTSVERQFEALGMYLRMHAPMEGIVWHHPDGRMAKIKRRDFE